MTVLQCGGGIPVFGECADIAADTHRVNPDLAVDPLCEGTAQQPRFVRATHFVATEPIEVLDEA